MNLVIDIGNTRTKFALFKGQTLFFNEIGDRNTLQHILKKYKVTRIIVSSVSKNIPVQQQLLKNQLPTIFLNENTLIPIFNKYLTPNTLGADRLANVVGANSLFPEQNILTIDLGTCIKYDFISYKKEYFGGAISPGIYLKANVLHTGTAQLPLLSIEPVNYLIGQNSHQSILSGIMNGTLSEMEGMIERYQCIYENLTVIITGGDAKYFEKELKCNIFAEPNLTLIGLNEILRYNG